MFRKLKIVLSIIFCAYLSVSAQDNYKFSHLNVRKGLAHNNVYSLFQDKTGFVWVGTQNGLSKFNGYTFQNYSHDAEDSTTLISDNFGVIFEDSKGRIWLGTYNGGITLYDRANARVYSFVNDEKNPKTIKSNMIRGILEDSYGNVWLSTAKGLSRFSDDGTFVNYISVQGDETTLSSDNIRGMSYDKEGYIWLVTANGLNRFDIKTGKTKRFLPNGTSTGLSSLNLQSVLADSRGRVWVGTRENGLEVYIKKLDQFLHFPKGKTPGTVSDARIQTIIEDSFGNFWIGTYERGLNFFDSATGKFTEIVFSEDDPQSLSHNTIEVIMEDNAANLWVGTRGGGISILDLKPAKFTNFDLLTFKLKDNSVNSIVKQYDNILWGGTKSGLIRFDLSSDKTDVFKSDGKPNSLSNDRIRSLCSEGDEVWVGTYEGGVNKIETRGEAYKITQFRATGAENKRLVSDAVNHIFKDNSGNIWVGHIDGLSKIMFDKSGNYTVSRYSKEGETGKILSDNYVTATFQDQQNRIWILTSSGLNLYNAETNGFSHFFHKKENSLKIDEGENSFTDIYQTHDGRLWVGTSGGGLFLFDPLKNSFTKPYKATKALSSIMSILADKSGNLWISTSDGLAKLDINTYDVISYGIEDDLAETGFNRTSACRTKDGTLYFGHISGYTRVRPENIKLNAHKPNVVLADFKKFNKSIFLNTNSFASLVAENVKELHLTYDDYVVSFEFAALDLTNPEKNKFAYMLEGYKDEWIEFDNQHQFMFTNLPAGDYKLKVRATNSDGIWCDASQMATIKLTVKPPFWKTIWFIVGMFLLVGSSILLFFIQRTRKLRKQNEVLEQKVEERTRALKEINVELEKLSIVARETDNSVTILDKHGNFEWFNEGFCKIFGYNTFEEFIQGRGTNILDGKFDDIIKSTVKEVFETKKTLVRSNRALGKSKTVWVQTTWTPILDQNGEVVRLIAVDSDISDLKEVEKEVMSKNEELENQNEAIKRYSENVRSSIVYAKTIQNSILPFKKRFRGFAEPIVFYRPKDIVSGDFYWTIEIEKYYFVAVVDCTGHGVPGAFMSLIGNRLLKEIIKDMHISKPNDILVRLNISVIQALNQEEGNNRDGMDVAIVRISKTPNEDGSLNIVYAGAKQDIFFFQSDKNKLHRIRGTRKAIGGKSGSNPAVLFVNERFTAKSNDVIYMMTDGYKDQNNAARERFGTQRLVTLLQEIAPYTCSEQESILAGVIEKFSENEPFRDDVTVVGLKLI